MRSFKKLSLKPKRREKKGETKIEAKDTEIIMVNVNSIISIIPLNVNDTSTIY